MKNREQKQAKDKLQGRKARAHPSIAQGLRLTCTTCNSSFDYFDTPFLIMSPTSNKHWKKKAKKNERSRKNATFPKHNTNYIKQTQVVSAMEVLSDPKCVITFISERPKAHVAPSRAEINRAVPGPARTPPRNVCGCVMDVRKNPSIPTKPQPL